MAFMFTQGEQLFTFQWGNERLASISSQAMRSEETSRREEDQLASFPLKQDPNCTLVSSCPTLALGMGTLVRSSLGKGLSLHDQVKTLPQGVYLIYLWVYEKVRSLFCPG